MPFPFPGDLPDPGIEPRSPALQADSSLTELRGSVRYEISSKAGKIVWDNHRVRSSGFFFFQFWYFVFMDFGVLETLYKSTMYIFNTKATFLAPFEIYTPHPSPKPLAQPTFLKFYWSSDGAHIPTFPKFCSIITDITKVLLFTSTVPKTRQMHTFAH